MFLAFLMFTCRNKEVYDHFSLTTFRFIFFRHSSFQVMLIYNMQSSNVPPALRLVNGSRGVVRRMLSLDECREQLKTQLYEDYALQSQALEHFVGCCGRDLAALRFPEVEFVNKVVRVITPLSFTSRPYGGGRVSRLQVPLILAWALTVHKSQGSSLDFVDVDCEDFFAEGQVYVALSRARNKDGMRVRNFNIKKSRQLSAKNADTLAFYEAMSMEQDAPGSVARALNAMQPWWAAIYSPGVRPEWRRAFSQSSVFQWWCRSATWERSQFHLLAALEHLNSARVFLRADHSQSFAHATVTPIRFRFSVSVYSVVITHVERLCIIADAAAAKLVQQMSRVWKSPVYRAARYRFTDCILQRVAAGRSEKTAEGLYHKGQRMYASGRYAEAAAAFRRSIAQGHLHPRADLAHMIIEGRSGVNRVEPSQRVLSEAFQLVGEGARAECPNCLGVLARCYFRAISCPQNAALSLQLARASSNKGSRYGQYVLGALYFHGEGGAAQDTAQALLYYRLSASQGLDVAQKELGVMYEEGLGVVQDKAEALRWYTLAAEQGLADAIFRVAVFYEKGWCVALNTCEATRLCNLALESDPFHGGAAVLLRKLGV